MRTVLLVLCLFLVAGLSCNNNHDDGRDDSGHAVNDQQAQVQDSIRTDSSKQDINPDQSGHTCGSDCECGDNGGGQQEPPTCESMGWECLTPDPDSPDGCPLGLHPTDFSDCENGTVCCVPNEYCFDEGEVFDAETNIGNCCPGLVEVGNANGSGEPCALPAQHKFICTACGDNACGPFENPCNCPKDCPEPSEPTCQSVNYNCKAECAKNEYNTEYPGCAEGQSCCSVVGCLPAGQVVMNPPYPEGCCDGLQEISATTTGVGGNCELDSDANSICAACPDGTCDEGWENSCNCPEDCDAF